MVNLSVAISNDYKDKQTGDWVKVEPTWVEVVVWGKLAQRCIESTAKGCRIAVQGNLNMLNKQREQKSGRQTITVEYRTLGLKASEIRFIDQPQQSEPEPELEPDF